jgi:putative membrane protein
LESRLITLKWQLLLLLLWALFMRIFKICRRNSAYRHKVDSYIDENVIGNSGWYSCLFTIVLIINVIRTLFIYFDYSITRQKVLYLLTFGLLNTKAPVNQRETGTNYDRYRNYFQRNAGILDLKLGNLLVVKRDKISNRNSGMWWDGTRCNFEIIIS